MVQEGIVLEHKISQKGLEVDKAKIDVIAKLPPPTNVKGIRNFRGHAGFYQRFIKDFSKITQPLTKLLEKDAPFDFGKDFLEAFEVLKEKLIRAPILITPDWSAPFELICDASDNAIGAVLGQRKDKHFQPIYYASKTLASAQENYTTTKKELLAVVFAFDKFRSYLIFQQKKNNFCDLKNYFWEDPFLFKIYADHVARRCVSQEEGWNIVAHCHSGPVGGHYALDRTAEKLLAAGFY